MTYYDDRPTGPADPAPDRVRQAVAREGAGRRGEHDEGGMEVAVGRQHAGDDHRALARQHREHRVEGHDTGHDEVRPGGERDERSDVDVHTSTVRTGCDRVVLPRCRFASTLRGRCAAPRLRPTQYAWPAPRAGPPAGAYRRAGRDRASY